MSVKLQSCLRGPPLGLREDLAGEVQVDTSELDTTAIANRSRSEGDVPGQPARTGYDSDRGVALLLLNSGRSYQLRHHNLKSLTESGV